MVGDGHLLIEHLFAEAEVQPRQVGVGAGPGEMDVVGDPSVGRPEIERSGRERAAGVLGDIDPAEMDLSRRHVLEHHVLERGIVGQRDGRADVRPAERRAVADPGLDDRRRTAGAERDHDAGARRVRRAARECDVDDVDRHVECHAFRDLDHRAIGAVGDVECHEGVGDVLAGPLEVRGDLLGMFGEGLGQGRHPQTVRAGQVDRAESTMPLTITILGPSIAGTRPSRSPGTSTSDSTGGPNVSSPSRRWGA